MVENNFLELLEKKPHFTKQQLKKLVTLACEYGHGRIASFAMIKIGGWLELFKDIQHVTTFLMKLVRAGKDEGDFESQAVMFYDIFHSMHKNAWIDRNSFLDIEGAVLVYALNISNQETSFSFRIARLMIEAFGTNAQYHLLKNPLFYEYTFEHACRKNMLFMIEYFILVLKLVPKSPIDLRRIAFYSNSTGIVSFMDAHFLDTYKPIFDAADALMMLKSSLRPKSTVGKKRAREEIGFEYWS